MDRREPPFIRRFVVYFRTAVYIHPITNHALRDIQRDGDNSRYVVHLGYCDGSLDWITRKPDRA